MEGKGVEKRMEIEGRMEGKEVERGALQEEGNGGEKGREKEGGKVEGQGEGKERE